MKKKTVIKKVTALSLCAALLLPAGVLAAEGPAEAETAGESMTEGDSAMETVLEEAAETVAEEGPAGESRKENTSTGYELRHFTLYNDGEMIMDMDNLQAELDFATVDGVSGVRLLIGSEDTEAGYIAASHIDDAILLVLHGELSEQTAKYKIDTETLTAILNSDDFHDFLRGTDAAATKTAPGEGQTEEPGTAESEEREADSSESEEPEEGQTEEPGTAEPEERETDSSESEETEDETKGTGTAETSGGFMINGLSLTSFAELFNEACALLNESIVKEEEVELGEVTLHRSGIILDREHMNRLLEICSELGLDRDVKKELDAQDIQPEGGALLWGSNEEDYRTAAGSFGLSVGDGAPVWNTFGADIKGKELRIYSFRMPDQQESGIESGMEIVFGPTDPESDTSWMPTDDADTIDVSEMEPAEAIERISTDVQTVLYDMMAGVLSVVLEEIPQETFNDILGIDVGEEAVSEPESETEADSGGVMSGPESETEADSGDVISESGTGTETDAEVMYESAPGSDGQ